MPQPTKTEATTPPREPETVTIEPNQWNPFLAEFTRQNSGAHARLDVMGPEFGWQVETENRPLGGVSADVKDGARNIWITFGNALEDHFTHGIEGVTALRVLMRLPQGGAALEVESR